jgi:hypothetical protein
MPNPIEFPAKEIHALKEWDERFQSPLNWTGEADAKLPDEATNNIEKTRRLLGPPVERLTIEEARAAANEYARKFELLEEHFAERLKGPKAHAMLRAYFMGPVFGFNIYAEGTSGVAKTWTMNQLCKCLDMPFATLHARSDTSDAELIGEERLVKSRNAAGKAESAIAFAAGVVTKPGVCGVLVDEFPRLPARSSNSCLQAMEDKWVRVPLNSLQKPDHQTYLSPHFSFIACGNPASYVGQGERNRALFDRFAIGIEVVRPDDANTFQMYRARDTPVQMPADFGRFEHSFRKVKAATRFVTFEDDPDHGFKLQEIDHRNQFGQLMAAAAAVSPADYLRRTGWVAGRLDRDDDVYTPVLQHFVQLFRKEAGYSERIDKLKKLRKKVNENVIEGSNPRGELLTLDVASALRVLDKSGDTTARFKVTPEHLKQAFVMANLVRIKPYPGCEDEIRPIVETAADIFFI